MAAKHVTHNPGKEEDMTRKLVTPFAAAAILSSVVAATMAFAQESTPPSQSPQAQHNMGDHGGMMSMMGQMSPDHMKQMTEMIERCNRMMTARPGSEKEHAPDRRE
jgi:hypothetical protein